MSVTLSERTVRCGDTILPELIIVVLVVQVRMIRRPLSARSDPREEAEARYMRISVKAVRGWENAVSPQQLRD